MYVRTDHRSMYLPWNIASESQSPEVSPLINQQPFANRPTQVQLLHLHFLIKKPIASLQLGDTAEQDCENQRGQERPYQSPPYADHRLCCARGGPALISQHLALS